MFPGIETSLADLKEVYPDKPIVKATLTIPWDEFISYHFEILDTGDFGVGDDWARFTKQAHVKFGQQGYLVDKYGSPFDRVTDLGAGGGGNFLALSTVLQLRIIQGIDIERWRLEVAKLNISKHLPGAALQLREGDAVEYLQHFKEDDVIDGLVVMCLPQSKKTNGSSLADVQSGHYEGVPEKLSNHGLELNCAALKELNRVAADDTRVAITLSERIDPAIHGEMFQETGWEVVAKENTMVQQDPDTDMSWMLEEIEKGNMIDDGKRFYQKIQDDEDLFKFINSNIVHTQEGTFVSMTIAEAVAYQTEVQRQYGGHIDADKAKESFNLYHGLSVYCLQKQKVLEPVGWLMD